MVRVECPRDRRVGTRSAALPPLPRIAAIELFHHAGAPRRGFPARAVRRRGRRPISRDPRPGSRGRTAVRACRYSARREETPGSRRIRTTARRRPAQGESTPPACRGAANSTVLVLTARDLSEACCTAALRSPHERIRSFPYPLRWHKQLLRQLPPAAGAFASDAGRGRSSHAFVAPTGNTVPPA